MTPSDVMSAAEAAGRLRTLEATITADGDGLWRGDPAVLTGLRAEARALRSVVALHERAAGTWLAGAQATRAADVAALRVIGGSAVYLAGLPLPTPDGNPPAPPQSPLPSPDGGTGPQGDGAPAGGCGVAAEALVGRWRRAALDAVAQRIREHRDAFVGQRGSDYTSDDYVAGINDCLRIILSNPREGGP